MEPKELQDILSYLKNLNEEMYSIQQNQMISNLLILSQHPNIPEDIKQTSLERAMNLLGYKNQTNTNEEGLNSRIF